MRLTLLPLLFYLRECGAKLLAFPFLVFDIMHIDGGAVHELFILVQAPFLFFI